MQLLANCLLSLCHCVGSETLSFPAMVVLIRMRVVSCYYLLFGRWCQLSEAAS